MAINFTYDEATNKVVQTGGTSGTPATFADFVTFDRAGVDTILLSAGAPANNLALTYAVRPVEDLAILVKCVVANKSAEADYIFITGKDWRGAAQTESIDVTAGNGSYTTTKYWSEITTLDCSDNAAGGGVVWADGDLSVTQDVWGVIWDYGGGNYRIDSILYFGDGVINTFFASENDKITFNAVAKSYALATVRFGIYNGGKSHSGCYITNTAHFGAWTEWDGTVEFYASYWHRGSGKTLYLRFLDIAKISWFTIDAAQGFYFKGIDADNSFFKNLRSVNSPSEGMWNPAGDISNVTIQDASTGLLFSILGDGAVARNITIEGSATVDIEINFITGQSWTLIDSEFSTFRWGGAANPGVNNFYEQYSCNIHIADKDGIDLVGATVDCEDKDGVAVWAAGTITTDAAGDIAEQLITYKTRTYDGGASEVTHSPHKFTISKAGYETMVLDAVTVDGKINWHLELLDELAEGDVRDGVVYGEDSEGNLELPAVGDVEDGVGFGSDGVEFTGDFEVPPETDVRDGEGYGAGGAEFEGDLDLPAIGDVEKGVQFDSLTKTGTFKSPAEPDVRDGEGYGEDDTEFTGTLDLPAEADVEDGVIFDGATKEGNFESPAEADVEDGIGYGAGGAEFEGDLELPAEDEVEVGVGYGSLGTEFEGTYLGLKGNNLTAVLEKSVALTGHLEKKVSLTGELKS